MERSLIDIKQEYRYPWTSKSEMPPEWKDIHFLIELVERQVELILEKGLRAASPAAAEVCEFGAVRKL